MYQYTYVYMRALSQCVPIIEWISPKLNQPKNMIASRSQTPANKQSGTILCTGTQLVGIEQVLTCATVMVPLDFVEGTQFVMRNEHGLTCVHVMVPWTRGTHCIGALI